MSAVSRVRRVDYIATQAALDAMIAAWRLQLLLRPQLRRDYIILCNRILAASLGARLLTLLLFSENIPCTPENPHLAGVFPGCRFIELRPEAAANAGQPPITRQMKLRRA